MAVERIQLRRGTATQWTDTNPILGVAEIGVETGTPLRFKIGDGSNAWIDLDYADELSVSVSEKGVANGVATLDSTGAVPFSQLANIIGSAPEALNTLQELAAALADDADFATTINGLLDGKADASHTHDDRYYTETETNSLLANKADATHTHAISDVTNLQTELDDKSDVGHTHVQADITDLSVDVSELTNTLFISPREKTTVSSSSITGSVDIDVSTQTDTLYTSDASGNFTFNIRGDASTTFSSILGVGESITIVVKVPNGSTAYYLTGVSIDGTSQTIKWLIDAPSYGTPSATDVYSLTITKTDATPTYAVFASQAGYV